MTEKSSARPEKEQLPAQEGKFVYVAPLGGTNEWGDDFDLSELLGVIWRGRLFAVLFTLLVTAAGMAYALIAAEWYRSEVVLIPARDDSMQGVATQFGGLASLAGLKLSGDNSAEPLAVLRSNGFAREFIRDESLTEAVLTAKRNPIKGLHLDAGGDPDIREAVEFFVKRVLSVSEDRKTGIVTLAIEWSDPEVAAAWANSLVDRLNEQMRARALNESNANIAYLRSELASTSAVALQSSIGRLLEMELQKAMVARGNREFSFRVVDKASAPRKRAWPKRSLIVALSFMVGVALSITILIVRHSVNSRRSVAA